MEERGVRHPKDGLYVFHNGELLPCPDVTDEWLLRCRKQGHMSPRLRLTLLLKTPFRAQPLNAQALRFSAPGKEWWYEGGEQ